MERSNAHMNMAGLALLLLLIGACKANLPGQSCKPGDCSEDKFCVGYGVRQENCHMDCGDHFGWCVSKSNPGQTCFDGVVASSEYCTAGNFCKSDENGSHICVPPGQKGDACVIDADCTKNYVCNQADGSGRCASLQPTGGGCARDADCKNGFCNPVFAPAVCSDWASVAEGGSCGADNHCQPEFICNNAYPAKATVGFCPSCAVKGQCKSGAQGQSCVDSDDCDVSLSCNQGVSQPHCIAQSSLNKGSACSLNEQCKAGLICSQKETPRVCEVPGEEGDPCSVAEDCENGLLCSHGNDPAQCSSGISGSLCASDVDCATSLCNTAMLPPECVETGAGKVGDVCVLNQHCDASLVCNTAQGECSAPGNDGTLCKLDEHCDAGLFCIKKGNAAKGECRTPGAQGAFCAAAEHCVAGLLCSGGYFPNQCGSGQNAEPCCHAGDCSGGLTCLDINGSSENCGGAACNPGSCHCESAP